MAPYHVMLVHFPIALWTTAALVIVLRTFSDGTLARAADRVLTPLLFFGALTGALAFAVGLLVWPFETAASSPLARNHLLLAGWSLAYWILLWIVRWRGGEQVWQGLWRWIMLGLGVLGVGLQTITGTLGGYLAGNPSMVSEIVRRLGWEVFTTFYLSNWVLATVVISAVVMAVLGMTGARARS
ncbi:MAG: heme ABC transporter permease [Betaproteobacteria bacterium]|nr:heme ABC transporter permease [Betaproteobacteria bacterium]